LWLQNKEKELDPYCFLWKILGSVAGLQDFYFTEITDKGGQQVDGRDSHI
jgi:hypothetical protein